MDTEKTMLARTLAPEEIKPGDYVAVLYEVHELLRCLCGVDTLPWQRGPEIVRLQFMPDAEQPSILMQVLEVCLPFVLVQQPNGRHRVIDTRRYRLARLEERFGRKAFKKLKGQAARSPVDP